MTAPHFRLILALALALVVGCGGSSNPDRPLKPEKLRVYVPATFAGMARKTATKQDDTKEDFSVCYQDLQNNKGDMFHVTLRDYAEDAFGERFTTQEDPKWKKLTHRNMPCRELLNPRGKPTVEMLVAKRFLITVSGDEEKNRLIPVKSLLNVLDAFDIQNLADGKPPVPQKQTALPTTGGTSGVVGAGTGVVGGGGGAAQPIGPEPQPSWSPAPHPSGVPNYWTRRAELRLNQLEGEEQALADEILRVEKQLRLAGRTGNAALSRTLATQKQKFADLNKRDAETRSDLVKFYKEAPPDPTAPKPSATPAPPPKPKEPTLREKWTAAVKPLFGVKGKGKEALDILLPLPLDEKKTAEWHVAAARAYADQAKREDASDAMLMLSIIDRTPHPELDIVTKYLKGRAQASYGVALAAHKGKKLKDAVKWYMDAVRIDSTILLKDDQGLRETALKAMRQTVEKRPERIDLLYLLGIYSQAAGETATAIKSFQDYLVAEKDPYLKWRAEAWLKHLQR